MSDPVREAMEELEWLFKSSNLPDRAAKYNTVKAALSANGGEAEPVAWAVFADNGNIRIWGREKPEAFPDAAPLYLAPTVKGSLTVQSEPVGYADPDTLTDYRAGDRLHMPVYRPDASEEWQSGIPVYLHPAPPSVAVPDGWKLVPIEPTDEMVRKSNWSGNGDISVNEDWARKTVWDRMIYAAPSPDHSGGETDVRPPKHHTLKTDPAVFDRSAAGRKPWEIRLNDRDFQVGDTVTLQETVFSGAQMREGAALGFTGKELAGQITYVLRGPKYGLADGWCVFSVEPDHIADAGKVEPVDDSDTVYRIGDLGNQIHNLGCSQQNNEELADYLAELAHQAWNLQGELVRERKSAPSDTPSVPENEVKARVVEQAFAQLASEYAPYGLRNTYTAFDVSQHIGSQGKVYAARLRTAGDEGAGR